MTQSATVSEQAFPAVSQGTLCFAAAESLKETFAKRFDFWFPADGWQLLPSPWHDCAAGSDDGLADIAACHQLCESVRVRLQPAVERLGNSQSLLGIPVIEQGRISAVATRQFATDSPELLLQLANVFMQRWSEKEEYRRLKDENCALAEQVSQDFEELMFLRAIATEMDVSDTTAGLETLGMRMLNLLNDSIHAKTLVLVGAQPSVDHIGEVAAWASEGEPDFELCRAILRDLAEESHQQPVVRNRVHESENALRYAGVREFIIVPVATEERTLGWLLALNRKRNRDDFDASWQLNQLEFGTHEASLMQTAASIMASQTSNIELVCEKEELLVEMVRALVTAIEAKDTYTCGHSERVASYGRCLALHLGYTVEEADRLYLTGLLHDVGKIGVSDATLKKPGRLSDDEFTEIKRHPDEGWAILHKLKPLDYVLPGLLQHHERIDGQGYPDGLAGDEISLDGRILSVADAYDAMTSDRPYRDGMPTEKAEAILEDGAGTQWDADVVAAFFEVREEINHIRKTYQPRAKPVRASGQSLPQGCQMSQVETDDGEVLAWS